MDAHIYWDLLAILGVTAVVFKFWFLKSLKDLMQVIRLRERGIKSKGNIRSFLMSTNLDGLKEYHSVIEYRTQDGQDMEFDDRFPHREKPIIGQEVDILYDRSDFKNIVVDSRENYDSQVMLFCIATFAMALALFFAIITIKKYV